MNNRDVDWNLYRSFLAILQEGSLSSAARRLGLTQPTLGRHLEQLERALGTPLFTRGPTGLAPTRTAQQLAPLAQSMEASAQSFTRNATADADEVAGSVRITASEIVSTEVLPPILAGLLAASPQLAIELSVTNANQDLLRRDADVAVRMVQPTQLALVARLCGLIGLGFYAHQSYLRSAGAPSTLAALASHRLIGPDREALPSIITKLGSPVGPNLLAYRSDNQIAQLAALRAGVGIGICQTPLADRDPSLVRVLPEIQFEMPAWVVMHEDLRGSRRVRAVFDHLVDHLAAYARS
jgi:DNA-binding transcriptional LysR family regulator